MPSSKGEPDKPELREKVKEEVKALSKGGGAGSWSAWKAGELARRYEAQGGGYKDTGENKNKSKAGAPEPKNPKDKKESAAEKAHREKQEKDEKKGQKQQQNSDGEDSDGKDSDGTDADEEEKGRKASGTGSKKTKKK